jgi:hypothetical protein
LTRFRTTPQRSSIQHRPQAQRSRARTLLADWHAAAAWRADARRLLLQVVMRMTRAKLAAGFAGWRDTAAARCAKRETLRWVAARLRHRGALCALNRWRDYAGERAQLRGRAREVVKHMLLRRLYAGFRWASGSAAAGARADLVGRARLEAEGRRATLPSFCSPPTNRRAGAGGQRRPSGGPSRTPCGAR